MKHALRRILCTSRYRLTTSWSERGMDKVVLGIRGQRVAQLERYATRGSPKRGAMHRGNSTRCPS
jgi:hypothetical protein